MLTGWVVGVNRELGRREESLWELHIWTWWSCYGQSVKNGREGKYTIGSPPGAQQHKELLLSTLDVCLPEISGLLELQKLQGHAFV